MKNLATAGGVLVIICFFLPWMIWSHFLGFGSSAEFSAYDLTSFASDISQAANVSSSFFPEISAYAGAYEAIFYMFRIVLLAIPVCCGIGLFFVQRQSRGAALFFGFLAVLGLVIFSYYTGEIGLEAEGYGWNIGYRIGYWGTWIGLTLLIYGSFQLPSIQRHYGSTSRY